MMRRVTGICLVLVVTFLAIPALWAEEKEKPCGTIHAPLSETEKCSMCGMNLGEYLHVRFAIATDDGKETAYCGAQCGLVTSILMGSDKVKSMWATDFITGKPVNAKDAWYVFKSSVITDMSPGLVAFKEKEHAEKFRKGFGGDLLDYENAIATLRNLKKIKAKLKAKK